MKKITFALALLLLSSSVFAWTIGPMNFQGRLLDNNGVPVTGAYNFKVRIYDALTNGTLKFSEDQSSIAVNDGVYSFLVSTGTNPVGTWDINLWNTPTLYMEVEVNGQILTPRHLLASTPFAYQANLALTTNNALALGGKSSGAVLADICAAGKGKWLEIAQKCLGIGAAFPGPTQVNISTLTASTVFTNLDLTGADISGINFGASNFSGTLLKGTIIKGGSFTGANFKNTTWDGVTTTSAVTVDFDLSGSKLKNMTLASFSFNNVNYMKGISTSYLSACPVALPSGGNWVCRTQHTTPSTVYMLTGPYVDFSATTSATIISRFGAAYLDVDDLKGTLRLDSADFRGTYVDQAFTVGMLLQYADFTQAELHNIDFSAPITGFTGAIFKKAVLNNVNFTGQIDLVGNDFSGAELNNVSFRGGILEGPYFDGAIINRGDFSLFNDNGAPVSFQNATIRSSRFWNGVFQGENFNGAKFFGDGPTATPMFWKANFSSFVVTFVGAKFYDMLLDSTMTLTNVNFTNTNWYNPTFNSPSFAGVNFQGAHFYETTNTVWPTLSTSWAGTRCPDGVLIPNPNSGGVKCNVGHLLP